MGTRPVNGRLGSFLRAHSVLFVGAAVMMAVATVFAFAVPIIVQVFLDSVFGGKALPPFAWARELVQVFGGITAVRARPLLFALTMPAAALINGAGAFLAARWMALGA